jgi:N-acetylglucosamine-6-sulfatase
MKRTFITLASSALAVAATAMLGTSPVPASHASLSGPAKSTHHPNVVVILVDDATTADVASMPNVQRLIASEGTTFTRNYSPDPICCPARATILTGRYPHNHRVLDNVAPLGGFTLFDDSSTVATWLDRDYRTGLFGKYMNDNASQGSYVPPGWDTYKAPTRHDTYHYVSPHMWVNGTLRSFPDEVATNLYSKQARAFMSRSVKAGQPFFAYLAIVAPHAGAPHDDYPFDPGSSPWVPPEYRNTEPRTLPADPSVNEADVSDKPSYVRDRQPLTEDELDLIAERDAQERETLKAVDDEVEAIVGRLADLGVLDHTYIVFASDNGYMDGQHRIKRGKAVPYEPSARVPLLIRGPGFPAGASYDRVTGLQDLGPTILGVTHEQTDSPIDGVSLRRLAHGAIQTDRPQLIEIPVTAKLSDNAVQRGAHPTRAEARVLSKVSWFARGYVTSNGWKYVEYPQASEVELYDLNTDPFELQNLANDSAYRNRVEMMSARLHAWKSCDAAACR